MEAEFKVSVFGIMKTSTPAGRYAEDGEPGGDTVRATILEHWDKAEKIIISFEGITSMTRTFVDEAFAKVLETHSLEGFNEKLYFPDANDRIVKNLNDALKVRMKIIQSQKDRADMK